MKLDWIIPAAGQGRRMGGSVNKLLLIVGGRSIFYHTLSNIAKLGTAGRLLVLCREEEQSLLEQEVKGVDWGDLELVWLRGGKERSDSVRNGLDYLLKNPQASVVLTHDGARPFLTSRLVAELVAGLEQFEVTVPAMPVSETTRRQLVGKTEVVDREQLYLIQTPQAFKAKSIEQVFFSPESLEAPLTDEASFFEAANLSVGLVPGEIKNIKLTRPDDLRLAEIYLKNFMVDP